MVNRNERSQNTEKYTKFTERDTDEKIFAPPTDRCIIRFSKRCKLHKSFV